MNDIPSRDRRITAWLCLCPLLAIANSWQIALALATGLLVCVSFAGVTSAILRGSASSVLHLPLTALVAGTFAVLEHLALATWWPAWDPATAPWLALVAGLAVLVCCPHESLRGYRTLTPALRARRFAPPLPQGEGFKPATANFIRSMEWGIVLSMALLLIGVARDGFGPVFLIANTSVGALVLLALVLAAFNAVALPSPGPQPSPTSGDGNT